MSNGKHFSPARRGPGKPRGPWRFSSWRTAAVCALAAVLAAGGIAGVIAWATAQDALTNAFAVGKVEPDIEEDFKPQLDSDGLIVKQDVKVTNKGSIDIYVRAQVNIYWIDEAGNQLWEEPAAGEDYTIDWGGPANWVRASDGYRYWTAALAPSVSTDNLIDSVTQNAEQVATDETAGRHLAVDIDIQGIQAEPAAAVQEAWGVNVNQDGALSVTPSGTSSTTTTEEA